MPHDADPTPDAAPPFAPQLTQPTRSTTLTKGSDVARDVAREVSQLHAHVRAMTFQAGLVDKDRYRREVARLTSRLNGVALAMHDGGLQQTNG
jgi:hypothetical protein